MKMPAEGGFGGRVEGGSVDAGKAHNFNAHDFVRDTLSL